MMSINVIYITTGSIKEAMTIGNALVTSKLAACANIIDNMRSIYHWDGKLQNDTETILIVKTTEARVPELIEKVKSMHSYDCPCIINLKVTDGNQAFLAWIEGEVT